MSTAALPSTPSTGLYRTIWRYAQGARLQWIVATAMLASSQLLKLMMPWMAAKAIDSLQNGGADAVSTAGTWIGSLLAICAASWVLHGPGRVLERRVGVQVRQGVSEALYARLTRAPISWHDRHHSADVQQRVGQATNAIFDFSQNQFQYVQSVVNFVGPLVALLMLSTFTGSAALLGYAVLGFAFTRFDKVLLRLATKEIAAERKYQAGIVDFVGNIATIVSLRLQDSTRRMLAKRLEAVFEPLKRSLVLLELKWCAIDLLGTALTWGLVVAYVWHSHGAGQAVMLGSVFMIYTYASQAGGVLVGLAGQFGHYLSTKTNFASADEIWNAPQQLEPTQVVAPDWNRIELRSISYAHGNAEEGDNLPRGGIHNVTLDIHRGERVALVGPSGSGKSTLLRILAGLYEPASGHYEVDGIAQLGVRHLGSVATLIPQEADVFEATVRENIAFDLDKTPAELEQAIHASAFDVVLEGMPAGLDTPITERGFNLSGGQRQRLCLARGLLAAANSSVVLLDEPTSALDPLTEASVHRRINEAHDGATVIASVHRMSLLEHFDRVVLMVDGRIIDSGSVADVARRQQLFSNMLNSNKQEPTVQRRDADPVQPAHNVFHAISAA